MRACTTRLPRNPHDPRASGPTDNQKPILTASALGRGSRATHIRQATAVLGPIRLGPAQSIIHPDPNKKARWLPSGGDVPPFSFANASSQAAGASNNAGVGGVWILRQADWRPHGSVDDAPGDKSGVPGGSAISWASRLRDRDRLRESAPEAHGLQSGEEPSASH